MIVRELSTWIAKDLEVTALIQTLHDAGKRLEELTEGEVDAVADGGGSSFLLHSAQDELRILQASKQAAVLNAVPANIALIDAHGVIVSVNEAWRSFADSNVPQAPGHGVGVDYLSICEGASGEFSAEAHAAAQAIRDVVSGKRISASFEYPCDSRSQRRRFLMTVTPLAEGRANGAVVMHIDVTARVLAAEALERQRVELRALVSEQRESARLLTIETSRLVEAQRLAKVGDWEMDLRGNAIIWSQEIYRIHEVEEAEFVTTRRACMKLVHPDDRATVTMALEDSFANSEPSVAEHRILLAGNRVKFLEERWQVTFDGDGVPLRANGTCQDITDRKLAETKLRRINRVYEVLSETNALIVRAKDRNELYTGACRIAVKAGFLLSWIGVLDPLSRTIVPVAWSGRGQDYIDRIPLSLDNERSGAVRTVRDGKMMIVNDVRVSPFLVLGEEALNRGFKSVITLPISLKGQCLGLLAIYAGEVDYFTEDETQLLQELANNISFALDNIEKGERLDFLAYYDDLTGLANQSLFVQRLQARLMSARTDYTRLAVIVLDVQRFRSINDALGRTSGDELLQQIGRRLVEIGGDATQVARIGPDRFAVVSSDIENVEQFGRYMEQWLGAAFGPSFKVGDTELHVSINAGIAIFPDDGKDSDHLLRNAEAAEKKAKASGDRYLFFAPAMTARVAERLSLERRLRDALDNEEFVLHYQPKVNFDNGYLTGAEALIRWNDPRSGLVPPMQFIPILEETGLIHEVGRWALLKSVAEYVRWITAGLTPVRIAVNVSPLQLRSRALVHDIEQILSLHPMAAAGLELEITESLIMEDVKHSIEILQAIRATGVTIAIDDFGTGYSSLSYLSKLPVDTLKIDRAFINDLTKGPEGMALVSTIITLAHSLKLKVVAEGVETDEQCRFLRLLQCDEMQGFLFSKPLPMGDFESRFMKSASSSPASTPSRALS